MAKEEGCEIIRTVYKDFKTYFEEGKIIVGGSFYYGSLGYPSDYKDVDFIIDSKKKYDYIVEEIYNHYLYEGRGWISQFQGNLCAGLDMIEIHVDIIRNDFTDNLSPFEIIPGVWTHRQSNKKLIEVYDTFIDFIENMKINENVQQYYDERTKLERIKKFKDLKNFFQSF